MRLTDEVAVHDDARPLDEGALARLAAMVNATAANGTAGDANATETTNATAPDCTSPSSAQHFLYNAAPQSG